MPEELLHFVNCERIAAGAYSTIHEFESALRRAGDSARPEERAAVREVVRKRLLGMRVGLDPKQRHKTHGPFGLRALFERELWPVAGTLIIVPKPLLQHWAEQLRLHVDLVALSPLGPSAGGRGAVWVDDLGDPRLEGDVATIDPGLPVPCVGGAYSRLLDDPGLAARLAR